MRMLSNFDLSKVLAQDRGFLSVFPREQLPKRLPYYPTALIINTDTANLRGKHWVAIFIDKNRLGEYYDSAALPPPLMIVTWLNRFTSHWKTVVQRPLQNPLSTACGYYVIYFIKERFKVLHSQVLMQVFSNDVINNDSYVIQYVNRKTKL